MLRYSLAMLIVLIGATGCATRPAAGESRVAIETPQPQPSPRPPPPPVFTGDLQRFQFPRQFTVPEIKLRSTLQQDLLTRPRQDLIDDRH